MSVYSVKNLALSTKVDMLIVELEAVYYIKSMITMLIFVDLDHL